MKLNRAADFGVCSGTGIAGAQFYQGGHYFGPDDQYLFSNPGLAPPPGVKRAVTMEEAEAAFQRRAIQELAAENAAPQGAPPAAPSAPVTTAATDGPATSAGTLTREQKLNQFQVPQLQNLMLAALQAAEPSTEVTVLKKKLIRGAGAKAGLVKWLLENTAE